MRIIPLSQNHEELVSSKAKDLKPRVKRWVSAQADTSSTTVSVKELYLGRYSGRCHYQKIDHSPRIRSCGIVKDGTLFFYFGKEERSMQAPFGWVFGEDINGLFLERINNKRVEYRYHFESGDLSNKTSLRNKAILHEKTQKNLILTKRFSKKYEKLAKKWGVFVTFRDSRKAGNCSAGTKAWASKNNLNVNSYYPVSIIEKLGNNDKLVKRACQEAINRSVEDMKRGYCSLK